MRTPQRAGKGEIVAWAMYDFANSAFTTVIVTVAYSVVFTKLIAPGGDWLWGAAFLGSNLLVVIAAPVVGAIGDAGGRKKSLLAATTLVCVGGTAALALAGPGEIGLALGLFVVANTAYALGEGLVGAFLPEISTPETVGRVSGLGWGLGYLGGLGCLLAIRPLMAGGFEPDNLDRLRWIWPTTAAWFAGASLLTFLGLRERAPRHPLGPPTAWLRAGFRRLAETARSASDFRDLSRFLTTFAIYSCGLAAVIAFAAVFAERELDFTGSELVTLFMLLQLSSAAGAVVFGFAQDRVGSKTTLAITLVLWMAVSAATALCRTQQQFWIIAMVAGAGIGSLQAASRALVSLLSPPAKAGEFFGLWTLAYRLAAASGPLLFGLLSSFVSIRAAIAVNGLFFLVGMVGLTRVDERRGRRTAVDWAAADGQGVVPDS